MNKNTTKLIQDSVNFAARFGFLTKDIFFESFCQKQSTQNYHHWKGLITEGYFYRSPKQTGLYYLTPRGKKTSQFQVAPNKSLYFLSHDLLVANIFLELEESGLLLQAWTEFELARDPYQACVVLGVSRVDKFPDLVVDLKGANKNLRIAIEVENTLKSKDRYQRISHNYLNMKGIGLLVYCCSSVAIQNAVRKAFSDSIFYKEQKSPISFLTTEFEKHSFDAEGLILNRKMALKNMLLAALEINRENWKVNPKRNRNAFRKIQSDENKNECHFSKTDQELEPARPTPAPWQSLRDHPHPTMLTEGGHEPGAGVGRGPDRTEEELKE